MSLEYINFKFFFCTFFVLLLFCIRILQYTGCLVILKMFCTVLSPSSAYTTVNELSIKEFFYHLFIYELLYIYYMKYCYRLSNLDY